MSEKRKYDHCPDLSGDEADLVGSFSCRYGAYAHWNVVFRLCTVILYRLSGGEYIMSINQRVMKRPLVIEEERLNFDQKDENAKDGGANEV